MFSFKAGDPQTGRDRVLPCVVGGGWWWPEKFARILWSCWVSFLNDDSLLFCDGCDSKGCPLTLRDAGKVNFQGGRAGSNFLTIQARTMSNLAGPHAGERSGVLATGTSWQAPVTHLPSLADPGYNPE